MGGPNDTKEEHGGDEPKQSRHEQSGESGNTGHGAASALAHMISQDREHRHKAGEADNAAGANGQ